MTLAKQALEILNNGGDIQDFDFPEKHPISSLEGIPYSEGCIQTDDDLVVFKDLSAIIATHSGWIETEFDLEHFLEDCDEQEEQALRAYFNYFA